MSQLTDVVKGEISYRPNATVLRMTSTHMAHRVLHDCIRVVCIISEKGYAVAQLRV